MSKLEPTSGPTPQQLGQLVGDILLITHQQAYHWLIWIESG